MSVQVVAQAQHRAGSHALKGCTPYWERAHPTEKVAIAAASLGIVGSSLGFF